MITHADERKRTFVFFWDWSGPEITIRGRREWDSEDPEDVELALNVIDGDVPLEGWVSLARDFLAAFDS
ncbi:hypothetical protein AWC05_07685 [Mycobacterium florentinum]|uniref:Uncharacterized protein n=1 Tax=Mycobacterium florentinum TaxID=292462 RepID=A0A1X1TUY2_MYCFL|nr:hypothetical protein [Mycobacterium florentinum]MCV7408785.1 hypothetical protein [Mycobacterium florentinum]ORV48383.1 hypothetical protein AWC05_07685 [Mycobacterium florentinum]BBX77580.1 hypothetical protein MFLOJ_13670 [Mycobacterium florentinum]